MARLAGDLSRLGKAARTDLPDATARELLQEAKAILASRGEATSVRLATIRNRARRRTRIIAFRRMLIPAAAAAAIILGFFLATRYGTTESQQYPAIRHLYADAKAVSTVDGISRLEPVARRALDEVVATLSPDVGRVANLQLVHYITLRPVEAEQIEDIHFLLALLQEEDRKQSVTWQEDLWDFLSELEPTACAATSVGWLDEVQKLVAGGRYDDAYQMLARSESTRIQPLTAYMAIRSGRPAEARRLLEALVELDRGDQRLVKLLWAELAMTEDQFEVMARHYISAAESDSRLWFQAAYLCKYEVRDDVLAGQLFQNSGDERVAAHIEKRFKFDVYTARQAVQLFAQDFEAFPVGSVPPQWKLVPTHAGEYEIADVDGSNVLKLNELGYHDAKLYTGYPGWRNYTLSCDFKFLKRSKESHLQLVVYEHGVNHYAFSMKGRVIQLVRNRYKSGLRPAGARAVLPERVEEGDWWRCTVQAQNLGNQQTRLTLSIWPRDLSELESPQILWTDTANEAGLALRKGMVAFRVSDAEVAFDNVTVTANDNLP